MAASQVRTVLFMSGVGGMFFLFGVHSLPFIRINKKSPIKVII